MKKISSKFAGQYVALGDGKIITFGKTTLEVYKKAKQLFPDRMVTLEYIPTRKEVTNYFISAF